MHATKNKLLTTIAFTVLATTANAATYYVEPEVGSDTANGEFTTPFKTIEYAVGQATGGDTIYLMTGHYGAVELENVGQEVENEKPEFDSYLNIRPLPGEVAKLDYLYTSGAKYLNFSGLEIMPRSGVLASSCGKKIVCFDDSSEHDSSHIVLDNSIIQTVETISATDAADPNYWADDVWAGVYMTADNSQITNNRISNTNEAIRIPNTDSNLILNNQITNLHRGIYIGRAHNATIDGNIIKNFYGMRTNKSAAYSDYAILNYSPGADSTKGVTISNNYIVPHETGTVDVDNVKYGGAIISYWGILEGWKITKNIILSGSWHSITLYDTINPDISKNLEVDYNDAGGSFGLRLYDREGYTRGMTASEKNQRVTCNIMSSFTAPDVIEDTNNEIGVVTAEDWAVVANSIWDESCNIELEYSLIEKF